MGDIIELPKGRVKGFNLRLDGKSMALFECESLERYMDSYQKASESVKKRHPVRSFINDNLYSDDSIQFLVREICLRDPYVKYSIKGGKGQLRKWFLLSQKGAELPAFVDLSENSLQDNDTRSYAINSEYNDIASVVLSSLRTGGIRHAEIYQMRNHSLGNRSYRK